MLCRVSNVVILSDRESQDKMVDNHNLSTETFTKTMAKSGSQRGLKFSRPAVKSTLMSLRNANISSVISFRETMRAMYMIVVVATCLLQTTHATDSSPQNTDDWVQKVTLSGKVQVDGSMTPPAIQISFRLSGSVVTLNLTRNENIPPNAPVIVSDNNGQLVRHPTEHPLGIAYYSDQEKSASVRLKTVLKDDLTFAIECSGTFQYNGVEHSIVPTKSTSKRRRRRTSRWSKRDTSGLEDDDSEHYIYPEKETEQPPYGTSLPTPGNALPPPMFRNENSMQGGYGRADYTVEMLVGIDYRLYKRWYDISSGSTPAEKETNTINDLRYYFSHIIGGVDGRYRSINSSDFSIRVRLVGFYIAKTANGSWFMENNRDGDGARAYIRGQDAIYALKTFTEAQKDILPSHDQFTIFTGDNMNGNTGNRISGLSFHDSMCTSFGLSLVRESGQFGTTSTCAHELGHNLGALHDGYDNSCNAKDNYIMAAGPSTLTDAVINNAFHFSPCSISEIKNSFNTRGLGGVACLLTAQSPVLPPDTRNLLPGQWYTPDQQCQLLYGSGSFYCSGRSLDPNICRNMQCFHPEWAYCVSTYTQIAFTGTSCGNHKWCYGGNCVYNASAPAFKDVCQYGDFKGALLNGMYCKAVASAPWNCYEAFVQDSCCDTCMSYRDDSKPDCLYGDRQANCDTQNLDCSDPNVKRQCCKTCEQRAAANACEASWCQITSGDQCYTFGSSCCRSCAPFKTAISGCDYGDWNVNSCKNIQAYECYNRASTCCQSCKQYESGITSVSYCKYGDRVPSCNIQPSMCYMRSYECCGTCTRFYTGIAGCEYGDKDTCTLSDCENPSRRSVCCKTCYGYTTTTSTTTTTRPTVTTPTTTRTTTTRPTTQQGSSTCIDIAPWCSTIDPSSCYSTASHCCATCKKLYIENAPGCEYGNKYTWCSDIYCSDPKLKLECCRSCGVLDELLAGNRPTVTSITTATTRTTTATTTTTTRPTTTTTSPTTTTRALGDDPTCVDAPEISWCKDMDALLCYNDKLRSTCCASCRLKSVGPPGCEYGDKITSCVIVKPDQCNYYRDDCCKKCGSS